jgi:hypothetical protein
VEIKTFLVIAHVLAVTLGGGGALMLDLHLLRHMRGQRLRIADVALVEFLGHFVKAGVIGLWATGILIMCAAPDGPTSVFAIPKVQAKLVIVVVLTLNALFIETLAIPLIRRNVGRRLFDGVDARRRAQLIAFGVVSGLSWMTPFVLGLTKEWNGVPAGDILAVYLALLLTGILFAQAGVRFLYGRGSAEAREGGGQWTGLIPETDLVPVKSRPTAPAPHKRAA